jgi:hypothetical protein
VEPQCWHAFRSRTVTPQHGLPEVIDLLETVTSNVSRNVSTFLGRDFEDIGL